ncbi:Radical SAM domain protein [Chloroherpeton thalassium ATCC 35110]|uniref:Radical SAM domain protein n=1 Tax=Chloroherpeton thalassium (strain ATCC 35110 / GB-78) TaxID=517418 RepID=B3QSF1_CHLT3|nr:radical SAM protein [Chloroherpeton thalassium]ACF12542.1 Radical SAM domain protein [Chloroherpeton thalassium ATCC 35110]
MLHTGQLEKRVYKAYAHLKRCDLCANYCGVDRLVSTLGAVCHTGRQAKVFTYGAHHGEENPLRGWNGSGTIFFSWCNLQCEFCQNWEISHKGIGEEASPERLAEMMLELQAQGCHNINFVSPSHVVAQIIEAVFIAAKKGLRLPLVYNTGGYDSLEALKMLKDIIDIYMPDVKFADSMTAQRLTHVKSYVEVNRAAVLEMHRQVGDLVLDSYGVAQRGLLLRHLVMPGKLVETERVLFFVANSISTNTYVNLMDQYHPCYRTDEFQGVDKRLPEKDFRDAVLLARHFGLSRLDRT